MRPEGWYPDPAGAPELERYWDGQSWSTVVRSKARPAAAWSPTGTYDPSATVPVVPERVVATGAPLPRRTGRGWLVLLALVLLGTIALIAALWRPWAPAATTASADPVVTAAPSGRPTTTATPPRSAGTGRVPTASGTAPSVRSGGTLSCTSGEGRQEAVSPAYTSHGLSVRPSPAMTVRLDAQQWSWLDDAATWATDLTRPVGFALGGLDPAHGFATLEAASQNYVRCLTTVGVLKGVAVADETAQVGTFAGRPAYQRTFVDPAGLSCVLLAVDTGADESLASILAFWPTGDAAAKQTIDALMASVRIG